MNPGFEEVMSVRGGGMPEEAVRSGQPGTTADVDDRFDGANCIDQTALANPLDKFQLGIRKLIEDLLIQRMADNDKIVTRYMDDRDFQNTAFPILAREIFEAVRESNNRKGEGRS